MCDIVTGRLSNYMHTDGGVAVIKGFVAVVSNVIYFPDTRR